MRIEMKMKQSKALISKERPFEVSRFSINHFNVGNDLNNILLSYQTKEEKSNISNFNRFNRKLAEEFKNFT